MSNRVLIVDDDPAITKLLEKVMKSNDLITTTADSGTKALSLLKDHSFDIVLLDITLGDMEGFEIIKHMRSNGLNIPVMVISGRNEDFDSLYGLSLGADDYITKPFRPLVVGAKVKALLRRSTQFGEDRNAFIERGPFTFDNEAMRFYKNGTEILLSQKENTLMNMFMHHPNQVFTKDMIYEQVWGTDIAVDDNAIMVYINRLRSKIEDDSKKPIHIITVRGMGYRFIP
ncbi:MAG: response regulator transcription factor [Suipraeoptans sp.]